MSFVCVCYFRFILGQKKKIVQSPKHRFTACFSAPGKIFALEKGVFFEKQRARQGQLKNLWNLEN